MISITSFLNAVLLTIRATKKRAHRIGIDWQISIACTNFSDRIDVPSILYSVTYHINAWQNRSSSSFPPWDVDRLIMQSMSTHFFINNLLHCMENGSRYKKKEDQMPLHSTAQNHIKEAIFQCIDSTINDDNFCRLKCHKKCSVVWLRTMSMHNSGCFYSKCVWMPCLKFQSINIYWPPHVSHVLFESKAK